MAIIKKTINKKFWTRCGEKGTLMHCWWEHKFIWPLRRTCGGSLKKLKIEKPYDPTIPLLGIYPEKTINSKRYMYPTAHCSTIYKSQGMEAT